jgi:hypothetical protein
VVEVVDTGEESTKDRLDGKVRAEEVGSGGGWQDEVAGL